jgi:hypothetical protein
LADRGTANWIMNGIANPAQSRALLEAAGTSVPRLSGKEYLALSPMHRALLADHADRFLAEPVVRASFASFPFWTELICRDLVPIRGDSDGIVKLLRKNPDWLRALNGQEYENAKEIPRAAWKTLTDGGSLPPSVERRLLGMLDAERSLWESQVSQTTWNYAVRLHAGEKGTMTSRIFWKTLLEILPEEQRTEKQRVLLAACMINRGIDPETIALTGINATLLKKHFPDEGSHGN